MDSQIAQLQSLAIRGKVISLTQQGVILFFKRKTDCVWLNATFINDKTDIKTHVDCFCGYLPLCHYNHSSPLYVMMQLVLEIKNSDIFSKGVHCM